MPYKRRINKPIYHYFLPVKLYLEDIETIVNKLRSIIAIDIFDSDYDYGASLDGFKEANNKKPINEFYITSEVINLKINRRDDNILTLESNYNYEKAEPIFYYLKDFLNSKVKWYTRILNFKYWIILAIFWMIGFPLTFEKYYQNNFQNNIFAVVFISLAIISFYCITNHWKISSVYAINKNEVDSFFERNKDQLISGIIIGALCALFGYLLGKI